MAAVAQSGVPVGLSMASPQLAGCLDALGRLGSSRTLEIGSDQAWGLIAVAGNPATNLAEGLGDAFTDTVRISAEAFLDADRDGLTDNADPDNDNDGIPDVTEQANGTDVLDPGS